MELLARLCESAVGERSNDTVCLQAQSLRDGESNVDRYQSRSDDLRDLTFGYSMHHRLRNPRIQNLRIESDQPTMAMA